jgi:hypothetical protein
MTQLRREIEQARDQHRASHYPGDLAAELLPARREPVPGRIVLVGGLTASAIAAGVALLIILHRPSPQTIVAPAQRVSKLTPPPMPQMPGDLPLVPPYGELSSIPARPSFPGRHFEL